MNDELASLNEEQAASNEELVAANQELELLNQQLLEARYKIEEGREALGLAIEAANFGTWYIHSVTRELVTNNRLKELFGFYPTDELTLDQAIAQISEEHRVFVASKIENAIYNNGDYDVSYPVIGYRDKRLRWLRAIGTLKADLSGVFSAFTGVVMDITEQKLDDLRKNDFIGMVSHELKTPLTSLSAIIQVVDLKLKSHEDTFLSGAMVKAKTQVKRISTMINGFLNISRLESGKILIQKELFNLQDLLREIVEETTIAVSTHRISVNLSSITIYADRDKINSVISNLISNAIKYSSSGSSIQISSTDGEKEVVVSVHDRGIGISHTDSAKIFDRYYRVESSSTQHISGFGIGLYLSAEIIKRHGGRIWVESEPGLGSSFYFSIPKVATL